MSTNEIAKKKNNKWIYIGIAVFLGFCCSCIFLWSVFKTDTSNLNTSSQSPEVSITPTEKVNLPSPTNTPELGTNRESPLPGAEGVPLSGNIVFTILSVDRHADGIVQQGNMFNATPTPNQEYATISIQVECVKESSEQCSFSPFDIKAVGSDGQVRDREFIAGVPDMLEEYTYDFFGGAKITGNLVFIFPKDDLSVVLFYEGFLSDPVYIGLP